MKNYYYTVLTTLCLLLTACSNDGQFEKDKTYTIKQGAHKSEPIYLPTKTGKRWINFTANFDATCLYSLEGMGEDALDINKLYGLSICGSDPTQNSTRFGWRHNGNGAIEVFAFWHINGHFDYYKIGETLPGIVDSYQLGILSTSYEYYFNDTHLTVPKSLSCSSSNYRSFPWFGGNLAAPNTMYIYIYETP
jgi:hypothetical protein